MEIINMNVNDLVPYENNARNNEDAVDPVASSIKEFGFKVPIIINKDRVIVTGHTRLKAAIKLGMTEVPTIMANDLNEDQIKAFRLVDNKTSEFADWDMDALEKDLSEIMMNMDDFGFDEMENDMMMEIDTDDLGSSKHTENYLKIGRQSVLLTEQEHNAFMKKLDDYIDDNGVSFGFVSDLLCL